MQRQEVVLDDGHGGDAIPPLKGLDEIRVLLVNCVEVGDWVRQEVPIQRIENSRVVRECPRHSAGPRDA